PKTVRQRQVDNAQGDRQARATVQDFVQKAVGRIVVVVPVAVKALLFKEELVQGGEDAFGTAGASDPFARCGGQEIEPSEVVGNVEVGIVRGGNGERGPA